MNNVPIRIALTSLALSAIVSPVIPALASWDLGALVYENGAYKGTALPILSGDSYSDLARYNFDNKISSMQVAPNCTLEAWNDVNYKVGGKKFAGNVPYLAAADNDLFSSMVVNCTSPASSDNWKIAAFVYDNANFNGGILPIYKNESISNLASRGWNGRISSIKVAPNCTIDAYLNANFVGLRIRYAAETSVKYVGDANNDKISSVSATCSN